MHDLPTIQRVLLTVVLRSPRSLPDGAGRCGVSGGHCLAGSQLQRHSDSLRRHSRVPRTQG